MKNKQIIAFLLTFVMAFTVCMPMGGMPAYAASAEALGEDESTDEPENVSPENAGSAVVDEEEYAAPESTKMQEGSEEAEVQEEPELAEEELTEQVEDVEEEISGGEAVGESPEAAAEEESVETVTQEPAAEEENEDPAQIIESVEVEENREAASDSSTRGNVAQAIYTKDNETLTFYYGPLVSAGQTFNGSKVTSVWSGKDVTDSGSDMPAWHAYYDPPLKEVTSVVFDESFLAVKPTSMHGWFESCYAMTSLDLSGLDTSQVTDMSWMFGGDLTSVDLRGLDTSNVTTMACMFSGCRELTTINMAGLNTSNVTDMHRMFSYCSKLWALDVTGIDTSKVTDMSEMFCYCTNIGTIRMDDFDSSNVTDMHCMFSQCFGMTSIDLRGMNTSNVTNMSGMFNECSNLVSVDLSEFNTSKATDMNSMFSYCNSLENVDVSKFDTSNVTDMSYMFYCCESLKNVDVSHFNTSKVTYMSYMFYDCQSLTSIDISSFNTSNVEREGHFNGLSTLFAGCVQLKTIYCSESSTDWKGSGSQDYTFSGCFSLVGQDGNSKTVYSEDKIDSNMAKSASLGGYFTPKKGTAVVLGKTTRGDMFNLANNVKVTWKEVPGAKYYKVYREGITDTKETRKDPVIVTTGLVGWDKETGLTNGHAYRYKIVASLTGKGDSSGDSKLSYSKVMYRLKTVVIRSVKNTAPGKVTVKYDKTATGDSYVLQYCEREDMVGAKTKVVLGANNTSYTIGGLKKGKTYYISIRVRKKVNGIDYYTTFGVPKKIKITQ